MSEYQYYEFQAIDRPLTTAQQAAMRRLSSRAELSSTRAAFNYSYGSFSAEPLTVLEQHFDALLYIANWGTKQLAFRFPRTAMLTEHLQDYVLGDEECHVIELHTTLQHVVLNLELRDEESYGWLEGAGILDPLIPLREAILRDDLRALYLFWLKAAEAQLALAGAETDLEPLYEPPVPPGLGQLDRPLQAFVELFEIDQDLITAAAEASPPLQVVTEPLDQWVTLLPIAERNELLVRVARGQAGVGIEVLRRLRQVGRRVGATQPARCARRSFCELQAHAKHQKQLRIQHEQEQAARARVTKLEALAQREVQVWASISVLLAQRTASGYDHAISQLADLRDLAVHRGQREAFFTELAKLIEPYAGSAALQHRLKEYRLV